jgi:neutral ceramidase
MSFALLLSGALLVAGPADWQAGIAVRTITPTEPMWLAGYSNRNKPSEGKLTELYAKALALQDARGSRFVLLTVDLVGVTRELTESVAAEIRKQTGLPRERLLVAASHTHCGPVIRGNLSDMYDMPADQAAKVGPYTDLVGRLMVEAVVAAVRDLKPARLAVTQSTARFAVNRRKPTSEGVVNDANPGGPVDHAVPVLRVTSPNGALRAVAFGYACHNTTMQFYEWSGDYAGIAMARLEEKHPKAVALFWAGCGGDANPLPRSKLELLQKYGRELADAVEAGLAGPLTAVRSELAVRYGTVALPYGKLPSLEQFTADLASKNYAIRKRAERFRRLYAERGNLPDNYPYYPIQVVRLGNQVTWIALGGEAVVDYSLRLKKELAGERAVWVAAYANNVMAYIPSARVLREGGYEADTSMIYYGHPTRWDPTIESIIVKRVHELVADLDRR